MNSPTPAYVLDHVGLAVGDLVASRDFYEQALAPLGSRRFRAGRRAG